MYRLVVTDLVRLRLVVDLLATAGQLKHWLAQPTDYASVDLRNCVRAAVSVPTRC